MLTQISVYAWLYSPTCHLATDGHESCQGNDKRLIMH